MIKKFKKKHRVLHRLVVFFCIVGLFWGAWQILDTFAVRQEPYILGILVIAGALAFLYLDDFHLKELE